MRIEKAGANNQGSPIDAAWQEKLRTQSKLEIVQDQDGRKIVNQYVLFEIVGRGSFGKVRRCVSINSGATYACKIMNKRRLKKRRVGRFSTALAAAQKEIAVWKKLRHPNIVSLHDVVDDPASDRQYLISDFVNGGPLLAASNTGKWRPLKRSWLRYFVFQLAEALAYLHAHGIAHRDIKPENILVHIENGCQSEIRPWHTAVLMPAAPMFVTAHQDSPSASSPTRAVTVPNMDVPAPAVEADSSDDEAFKYDTPVLQLSPAELQRIGGSGAVPVAHTAHGVGGSRVVASSARGAPSGRAGEAEALMGVTLKLADFGLAQVFDEDDKIRSTAGTAAFIAPEMVSEAGRKGGFSARKADVWALGVTLYMCIFGCMPFEGSTLHELYRAVQEDEPPLPPKGWSEPVDADAADLLRQLLSKSVDARITMPGVMQHAFVAGSERRLQAAIASADTIQGISVTDEELESAITPYAVRMRGLVRAKVATDAVLKIVRHRLHLAKAFSSSSEADEVQETHIAALGVAGDVLVESDNESDAGGLVRL
jgi:serine/threonine protein kinase